MAEHHHTAPPSSEQNRKVIRGKISKTIDRFERYPLLDIVWDQLIRRLMQRLAHVYGVSVEAQVMSKDILRFGQYMEDLPYPALLCVFQAREWHDLGLVVIDGGIAEANLEFLLGGDAEAAFDPEPRNATHLDKALARQLVNAVLAELGEAFTGARTEIGHVTMQCERIETSPQFATITRPQTPVFLARIQVDIGEAGRSGQIDVLLPMPMLEPIRRYLTEAYRGDQKTNDLVWARHITTALMAHPLPIDAELERLTVTLDRVMDWQVGDLLPLAADANTPVELHIRDVGGHTTVLSGKLGALRGNKAIKLLSDTAQAFGQPFGALAEDLGVEMTASDVEERAEARPANTQAPDDMADFGLGLAGA